MIVRIRLNKGRSVSRQRGKNRMVALGAGALLAPATLMAYVLGFWRLLSDIGVLKAFPIEQGLFSHWQVWLPFAGLLHYVTVKLEHYGRDGAFRWPKLPWRVAPSASSRQ
jgi:hypothetical protein